MFSALLSFFQCKKLVAELIWTVTRAEKLIPKFVAAFVVKKMLVDFILTDEILT